MVVACMGLAVVTIPSLAWLPSAVAQTKARKPVLVLGNAVGGVPSGTRQPTAIDELSTTFGSLKTTKLKAIGWCGLTAQSTRFNILETSSGGGLWVTGLATPRARP